MKIEIWSDVVCPFCYIGKRHLELAMEQLPELDIDITWKSFELDPQASVESAVDIYDMLAKKYGHDRKWAKQMNANVTKTAEKAGLDYDMDSVKPTNSFDAHRLLHLAKEHGKQDELEEILFSAYFTEGRYIGKKEVLQELGEKAGLEAETVRKVLNSDQYTDAVKHDIIQAKNIGVQGVPFFYINGKYGLSGAQPVETFVKVLKEVSEKG
ncbi:MAG: DsbA family oxidoreductase [Balneolaceae bacterium]